LSGLRVKKL